MDAGVARHRHDMRLRVARSADRGEQADRVEKTRARQDRRGAQVFIRHIDDAAAGFVRSEEHTSELQSLMRISYAVFCLKQKLTHSDYEHPTSSLTFLYPTSTPH